MNRMRFLTRRRWIIAWLSCCLVCLDSLPICCCAWGGCWSDTCRQILDNRKVPGLGCQPNDVSWDASCDVSWDASRDTSPSHRELPETPRCCCCPTGSTSDSASSAESNTSQHSETSRERTKAEVNDCPCKGCWNPNTAQSAYLSQGHSTSDDYSSIESLDDLLIHARPTSLASCDLSSIRIALSATDRLAWLGCWLK